MAKSFICDSCKKSFPLEAPHLIDGSVTIENVIVGEIRCKLSLRIQQEGTNSNCVVDICYPCFKTMFLPN